MTYYKWGNDLVIDNGMLDADHRQLVDHVNELHTATSAGRGREVVSRLLAELINSTAVHIQREEQFMAAIRYPDLDLHRLGHVAFMEDLRKLQKSYEAGCITVASQLSTTLRDWVSLHLRRYDKEIAVFMRKMERQQARLVRSGGVNSVGNRPSAGILAHPRRVEH